MKKFLYFEPATLDEALQKLESYQDRAKLLAGGTDLVRKMRQGICCPEVLLSLRQIEELNRLEYSHDDGLWIGAGVTIGQVEQSELVKMHYPILHKVSYSFGTPQIRMVGTIAGNICNASPAADYAPVLLALGARLVIAGSHGERELPLCEFFVDNGRTALKSDELLKAVVIPPMPASSHIAWRRYTPREMMEVAIVSVCAWVNFQNGIIDTARIAVGSMASIPTCLEHAQASLVGQPLTEQAINQAVNSLIQDIEPISDFRATAEYRCAMAQVNLRRALQEIQHKAIVSERSM